jgi:hypothetical protein
MKCVTKSTNNLKTQPVGNGLEWVKGEIRKLQPIGNGAERGLNENRELQPIGNGATR